MYRFNPVDINATNYVKNYGQLAPNKNKNKNNNENFCRTSSNAFLHTTQGNTIKVSKSLMLVPN